MEIGDKIIILKTNKNNINYKAGDIGIIVSSFCNYMYKDMSYFICEVSRNKYKTFFFIDEENSLFKKIKDKKKIG